MWSPFFQQYNPIVTSICYNEKENTTGGYLFNNPSPSFTRYPVSGGGDEITIAMQRPAFWRPGCPKAGRGEGLLCWFIFSMLYYLREDEVSPGCIWRFRFVIFSSNCIGFHWFYFPEKNHASVSMPYCSENKYSRSSEDSKHNNPSPPSLLWDIRAARRPAAA